MLLYIAQHIAYYFNDRNGVTTMWQADDESDREFIIDMFHVAACQ